MDNFSLSEGWLKDKIKDEESFDIGAGSPAGEWPESVKDSFPLSVDTGDSEEKEAIARRALGSLIEFLRRERTLSVEGLASEARIDIVDLLCIEGGLPHQPKPRTIVQLGTVLALPVKGLLKLANLTYRHGDSLTDAAIRFAAHSKRVIELTEEEKVALREFVEILASLDAEGE